MMSFSFLSRLILLICWVLLTSLSVSLAQPTQASENQHRAWRGSATISDLIKTHKGKEIVLDQGSWPPLSVEHPPNVTAFDWFYQGVKNLLVVEINDRQSKETPDDKWITTDVQARILEVLKVTEPAHFFVGQVINFSEEGGEIVRDGQRVVTALSWAKPSQVGKKYLVHALANDNKYEAYTSGGYELEDGKILPQNIKSKDDLLSYPVGWVISELRKRAPKAN